VETNLSFISLILEASLVVQIVMAILVLIIIVTCFLIIRKYLELRVIKKAADRFEDQFWSGKELNQLYEELGKQTNSNEGMEGIFQAGFKEFVRLRKHEEPRASMDVLEGAQRTMRISLAREIDKLETSLSFLATAGSISPYIGLFGTVVGIMNSFRALGAVQQATLAMVAPGIAEALIATAMGLMAAIPAVVAYNKYSHEVEQLINRYDTFVEEFSSILQRQ
jgi:biopolymer transport protein TolQ